MFVQRLAGPSRLSTPYLSNQTHAVQWVLGKRRMSRKAGGRLTSALVDPQQQKSANSTVDKLEAIKEQGEQMERAGNRGMEKRPMNETPLPTMDVMMVPERPPNTRELYFPYYPLNPKHWPLFLHSRPNVLTNAFWIRLYTTIISPSKWRPFRRLKSGLRWSTHRLQSLGNAILALGSFKWRNLGPISLYRNASRSLAKRVVNAAKHGPRAKELYMQKLENDQANFRAMLLIASKQRFPEWVYYYPTLANRSRTTLSYWFDPSARSHRKYEDEFFNDLSSPRSPLYPVLKDAAKQYVEMNNAIARGDSSKLELYAGKTYLEEIEHKANNIKSVSGQVKRDWRFIRWINRPVCISIRANDFFAEFNRSFVAGERLYVNMLVKFESMQSVTISHKQHASKGHGSQTRTITRPVTEYLVLDVRTWMDGRKPKFIQEVFEGQELHIERNNMTEEDFLGFSKGKKDEVTSNETKTESSPAAQSSASPAMA